MTSMMNIFMFTNPSYAGVLQLQLFWFVVEWPLVHKILHTVQKNNEYIASCALVIANYLVRKFNSSPPTTNYVQHTSFCKRNYYKRSQPKKTVIAHVCRDVLYSTNSNKVMNSIIYY